MQTIATLTKHRRESGAQFLAGKVEDPIELPAKTRIELRKSDLVGDEYELVVHSAIIPGVDEHQARRAREHDREKFGDGYSPF